MLYTPYLKKNFICLKPMILKISNISLPSHAQISLPLLRHGYIPTTNLWCLLHSDRGTELSPIIRGAAVRLLFATAVKMIERLFLLALLVAHL